jgi:predicted nucleic acid-binding protein
MPNRKNLLLLDSGVTVKWHIVTEEYASEAQELLLDGHDGVIGFSCSDQLPVEITSAFLKAVRRGRISREVARRAITEVLAVRFTVFRTTQRILLRAFELAEAWNQRVYDCVPVAMAERDRTEFWTADERLYNALHTHFPLVRWIAHYQRRRPPP